MAHHNADLTLQDTLMYVDIRERSSGSGMVMQNISLEERHQLHGIIDRHKGTLLESASRRLVITFTRAESALDCARVIRSAVLQLRNPPWGGVGFYSRILLTPMQAGINDPDPERLAELIFKLSIHLNGTTPDCIIATDGFLKQLAHPPQPSPRPLASPKGAPSSLFVLPSDDQPSEDEAATRAAHALSGAGVGLFSELVLKIGDKTRLVNPPECPLSIGRSKTCAIMLAGDDVSRIHGRIEFENEKYFYVDDSRNGSYVLTHDGNEVRLQKERLLLVGDGVISPGVPMLKQKGQVIRYRCAPVRLNLDNDTAPASPQILRDENVTKPRR